MMVIKVTAKDISVGAVHEPEECPIALACRRAGFKEPVVGADDLSWWDANGNIMQVQLPMSTRAFIEQFDLQEEVSPFDFELPVDEAEKVHVNRRVRALTSIKAA